MMRRPRGSESSQERSDSGVGSGMGERGTLEHRADDAGEPFTEALHYGWVS